MLTKEEKTNIADGFKAAGERMDGVEAVFVDANNKVHVSSGLKGKLYIQKPPTPGP